MSKLLLIVLCLLPVSIFAQNQKTFEELYGISWEEAVERYSVKNLPPAQVSTSPQNESSCLLSTKLTPQEELVELKKQTTKIKENIKFLSLTSDSANPSLLAKYQIALKNKETQITQLEKKLEIGTSVAYEDLDDLSKEIYKIEGTIKKLSLSKNPQDIALVKKYNHTLKKYKHALAAKTKQTSSK